MEVYVAIKSVAPGNDYKFQLKIESSVPGVPVSITSTDNSRIYRFTDVTTKYFPKLANISMSLSYSGNPLIQPKFTFAKFTLRFFQVD